METHEYYMVHHHIWEAAVPDETERRIFLCIGCLERRLGRRLVSTDFAEVPVNYFPDKSLRLLNRLGSWFRDFDGPHNDPREVQQAMKAIGKRFDGTVTRPRRLK